MRSDEEEDEEVDEDEDEDMKIAATSLKNVGNEAFRCGLLDKALHAYTEALAFEHSDDHLTAVLFANSAAVLLKMGEFTSALGSCESALKFDPSSTKALFRGAQACRSLGNLKQAAIFCNRGLRLNPNHVDFRKLQADLIEEFHGDAFETDLRIP